MTNKTPQEAVRGFGQAPTNFAIERTMDRVARYLGMDRIELRQEEPDPQGRVPVHDPERLDLRLGRLPRRARQGARRDRLSGARRRARRGARSGQLAGIGISTCLEPSGGNSAFEPLLNPKNETTTWMDSCLVRVDLSGAVTGVMGTSTSGQGHETLVSTVIGEVLERDPADDPRGARGFAQRAAVEQPGRQPHGDHAGRRRGRRGAQDQGDADRDRGAQLRMRDGGPRVSRTATSASRARRAKR